ncbi:MAG: beta-galactosidase [Armatimonadetes bacterium]|nr:beta-galactosidase [Armatimonadota bacterium]
MRNEQSRVSLRRSVALALCCLFAGGLHVEAAYILNGQRSTVGQYAYDAPLPADSPFGGDAGKGLVSFEEGALMDAQGVSLGQSMGFSATRAEPRERFVFIDFGREVILDSLVVRNRLNEWWGLSAFQVSFSSDGRLFSKTLTHGGAGVDQWPHEPGLATDCTVPVAEVKARFVRLRLIIPAWVNVQIAEIDIIAYTLSGAGPPAPTGMKALTGIVREYAQTPVVDRFSQWTREEWPGKIHSQNELVERHRADQARYANARLDSRKYDRFGGDRTLGIKKKTGRKFMVEKIGGRWWFITPDGYPFVMIAVDGMNVFDGMNMNTVIHPSQPDIPKRFEWIPEEKDERFKDCWDEPSVGIKRFDYWRGNLVRVFGKKNHSDDFYQLAVKRLWTWGFNSLGKWTWFWEGTDTPGILRRLNRQVPYLFVLSPRPRAGVQVPEYREVSDIWNPEYEKSVQNEVRYFARRYGNDPYYLGFTIRNEGWWDGETTRALLRSDSALPATKKAFVEQLEKTYGDIANLNKRCGMEWKSFDDIPPADLNPYADKLKQEVSTFIELASDRYYAAWRRAVDRFDPGRLILGSSFVLWWCCCPEWVRGSILHSDVMMMDWYGRDPSYVRTECVDKFAVPANKPVVLGEFGISTMDYGFKPWHNVCLGGQDERGRVYRYVNENLYANPYWLGTMYFIYRDQVLGGRDYNGGGESQQFGLVNNCDLPYERFVKHVRETNTRLFRIHAGKMKPVTREAMKIE